MSDSVTFLEAIKGPFRITDKCNFYTFPSGYIYITNLLFMILIIFAISQQIIYGNFIYGLIGGILSILFLSTSLYNHAYLVKGCRCAKKDKI